MDVNLYLTKSYTNPPCWELVKDVYDTELGLPVNEYRTINSSVRHIAKQFGQAMSASRHGFMQIPDPLEMCVVLMGKGRTLGLHHAGVYTGGRVLHALPAGNLWQDLASLRDTYPLMEFWAR